MNWGIDAICGLCFLPTIESQSIGAPRHEVLDAACSAADDPFRHILATDFVVDDITPQAVNTRVTSVSTPQITVPSQYVWTVPYPLNGLPPGYNTLPSSTTISRARLSRGNSAPVGSQKPAHFR